MFDHPSMLTRCRGAASRAPCGVVTLVMVLAFAAAARVGAQEATRVTGRVTGTGGQPVPAAQVALQTLNLVAVSSDDGRYTLTVLPASVRGQSVALTVRRVGFRPTSRQITLRPGTITEDFALEAAAVTLDQVVVTGTATATRERELGNTIGTIDVEAKLRNAPVANVEQLFQAREPGLIAMGTTGEAGTGGQILLRGINSLSQSNQPLIYLDGILINQSNTSLIAGSGGSTTSRLNDLPVADIARVEVIKGASATTLYGSQASGGVIQIFTKRGAGATPQVNLRAEMGRSRLPDRFSYPNPDHSLPNANDLIETALVQNFSISLRGQTGAVGYFTSGTFSGDDGSWPNNSVKRASGRVNLSVVPTSAISLDLSSQYLWNSTEIPISGNNGLGILLPILLGDPTKATPQNPFGSYLSSVSTLLGFKTRETFGRFVGGLTANHTLNSALRHRLTVGFDAGNGLGSTYYPFGSLPLLPTGGKFYRDGNTVQSNVDYAATLSTNLSARLTSRLSVGAQLNATSSLTQTLSGSNFAIPGLDAIGGTSTQSISEARVRFATGGLFVQEELGVADRLFLTGGVRVDGSTSFGENFGTQLYPKLGLSYVVSDEKWFRLPVVSSLKLRSAWGKAGKQPGAFDAVQTFVARPVGGGGVGLIAANPGNPDLAPEVTTEWEAGFDAGLWRDRASLKGTFYRQRTDDAILAKTAPGSSGFTIVTSALGTPTTQLVNAGALRNQGIEIGLDVTLLQTNALQWDVNASYARNTSEVLHLGGLSSIVVDRFGTLLRSGYPVSSKFAQIADGFDASGNPTLGGARITPATPQQFIGPAIAPNNGSFGTQFTFGAVRASATAQWATGAYVTNFTESTQGRIGPTGEKYYSLLAANGNNVNAPAVRAYVNNPLGNFIYKADWLKLRELTLSYALPPRLTRGMTASLYASGRNLFISTKYPGVDPEASVTFGGVSGGTPGAGLSVGTEYATMPQPRVLMLGVDLSFTTR